MEMARYLNWNGSAMVQVKAPGPEWLFFSLKDPIRIYYAAVDSSVFTFGVFLNVFLYFMIRHKTPATMRVYSKMLNASCVIDLFMCCTTFFLSPFALIDRGYRIIMSNGILRYSWQPIRYLVYQIWINLMMFYLITTICQYVYRYTILCREGKLSVRLCLAIFIPGFFLWSAHGYAIIMAEYPREADREKIIWIAESVYNQTHMTDINMSSFVDARSFFWWMHNIVMLCIIPCFYVAVAYCSVNIRRAINKMNVLKLKEYNKQVSAALLFQSLLPTMELVAWSIQIFTPAVLYTQQLAWVAVWSDILLHLVPVLNPFGAIMFVAPYRRALLGYLGIYKARATFVSFTRVTFIKRCEVAPALATLASS